METYLIRWIGHPLIRLSCLRLLRTCWRSSTSKTTLFLGFVCFLYLFCYETWSSDEAFPLRGHVRKPNEERWGLERTPGSPSAVRSNVVYITLRSKRHKPAVLRATLCPKSHRRKKRKERSQDLDPAEHKEPGRTESEEPWRQVLNRAHLPLKAEQPDDGGLIRIYNRKKPPWFSPEDINHMRLLSTCEITHMETEDLPNSAPGVRFKSLRQINQSADGCHGLSGVINRPEDLNQVFAFHLDRVLGLNRSLPAISRRFRALDGRLYPLTLYDPSAVLIPEMHSGSLTWRSYQNSLKYRCWQRGPPNPEWSCSSVHHYEWSRLALFDFLLQIHQRLDRSCCGFRPRPQDSCVQLSHHAECSNMDDTPLLHIVHRKTDPRRLVYSDNKVFFDRDEENLDLKLLEGIKELPDAAVRVLHSRHLREKLLQSLFLDELYWEGQGGREGIEKLIDVIERRAKVLLRYINTHDIKVIRMNP